MLDSHHHLWQLAAGPCDYPKAGDAVLYRDFTVADLEPLCHDAGVGRTIVVQATAASWETEQLVGIASGSKLIAGVVGWCDLEFPELVASLDRLLTLGPLVGVRPMLQRWDDVEWLLDGPAADGLAEVAARGLVFDALVDTRHLGVLSECAGRHPDLAIVIDHMAKPWRSPQDHSAWTVGMQDLARRPNVHVKVSGFPFGASGTEPWDDYPRLCRLLYGWFGRERLLWGSDWPVLTRHATYAEAVRAITAQFRGGDLEVIGGGNARRVYRLPDFIERPLVHHGKDT